MAFCKIPARVCVRLMVCVGLAISVSVAVAFDFHDTLRTDKIPDALVPDISPISKGSIAPGVEGLAVFSESTRHAIVKFENTAPGADELPLVASVRMRTVSTFDAASAPGFYFYWDDKNYAYFRATHETHVLFGWKNAGEETQLYEHGVMRDTKTLDGKTAGKEILVRLVLMERNLAFYLSSDGINWRKIGDAGLRPGIAGVAPRILLGRGAPGEKPNFCNDTATNPKEYRPVLKCYFSDLTLADHGASVKPDVPEIDKKETWEQTLAALESAGIPRSWTVLHPAGDKVYHDSKDWLTVENWSTIKDLGGKAVKVFTWDKPDDEADDPLVDLRDRIDRAKNSTILCRTDIEWPVAGEATVWFDSMEPCRIFVNNKLAYEYQGNEWWREKRPVKDRTGIPVFLEKGKNSIKMVLRSIRGDTSFFMRVERDDVPRQLGLIQKMLELFPPPAGGWRGEQALFDLAQARETALDFKGALEHYSAVYNSVQSSDENQERAFEAKLRIYVLLRQFDEAIKTADAFLAAHPGKKAAASARRSLLRFETLAGRAGAARERARNWNAKDGTIDAAETLRIVAGALNEAGARAEHLATLEEIAASKDLKPEDRARAAIESGSWRIEYERRKGMRGVPPDPAEQERACRSMMSAVAILPGGKNPAAQQWLSDAEAELNNKKPDRAYGAAWGAALTALLCSDADSAYYFAANKGFAIDLPLKDKNNNVILDQNQFKEAAWAALREKCGDPAWSGRWRVVSFKRSRDGKANTDLNGPLANSDMGVRYGDKSWNEIDPENDRNERSEFGFDVKRFSGDGGVVWLARDFDMPSSADTTLHVSNSGVWAAWIDGKSVGDDLSTGVFRIEADRLPLHLEKGKHRLLIRIEPPTDGTCMFRARIGSEPHMAMLLAMCALTARNYPTSMAGLPGDLNAMRDGLNGRSNPGALMTFAQTVAQMYDDQKWFSLDQMTWAAQVLHEANFDVGSMRALRVALQRLEDGPDYQGRSKKVLEVSRALARALANDGAFAAADEVLSYAVNRYPNPPQDAALCLAWRGTLRWELGMSQAALPFFERCSRLGRLPDEARPLVGPGLEWARFARPERIAFESSRDVQSQLDALRRQLNGAPEDVEKAMRGLSEILLNTSNSLVKIAETPFAVRYVGVREFIRSMLDSMTPEQRATYRKVVGEAAAQKLQRVSSTNPLELEKVALEFPFTMESQNALSRAGDVYLDRGRYGQAASIFATFLREPSRPEAATLACGKLALAQAYDGQKLESESALKRLESEFAKVEVQVKGAPVTGAVLAERLRKQIAAMNGGAVNRDSGAFAYMGGLTRTGATQGPSPVPGGVAWAQPSIASGAEHHAKSVFGIDAKTNLQSVPVTDGKRVFVGAMESLRALDLESGRIVWTQTWAGGAAGMYGAASGAFNGFPSSVPLVNGDKVVVRAQSVLSSLKCFDGATGALRWSSDAQPELKKLVWTSDPAAAYGMIFAMYIEPGDFNVHGAAALDAETGRLRWRTSLASGATGIKIASNYFQATNHNGPPAIDAGELYVETGLASVAAINAFTGEARWVSSYPRMQIGDLRRGVSGTFDLGVRSSKTFSRGPLSPMVFGLSVVVSPHDGNGVISFDRRDGTIRWHRELLDCRYIAGMAGGSILACDDGVTALNAETGATAWSVDLSGQGLQGSPTLSGNTLYMPMQTGLLRVNALNGTLGGVSPWDPLTGPVANLVVTAKRIVGVSERSIVGLGTGQSGALALPFYEAKNLEADGKLEEAAKRYADAQASDKDGVPQALMSRVRVLKRLNKRDEALREIARFEREAPAKLSAMGGLWTTQRDAVVRSLRASLGEKLPENPGTKNAGATGLAGVLAYTLFLPGDNPQVARFENDPSNRICARLNGDVKCLSLGDNPEIVWSAYVGTQVKILACGDAFVVAVSDREIAVLDRETGEIASQIAVANPEFATPVGKIKAGAFKAKTVKPAESFAQAVILNGVIYAATDTRLGAWDAASGRSLWERAITLSRFSENALLAHDGLLQRVYQNRDEIVVTSYDCATGTELQTVPVDKSLKVLYSPDRHFLLGRTTNRLTCVDLLKMSVAWRKDLDEMDVLNATFEFLPGGQLRYAGVDKVNTANQVVRQVDLASGNSVIPGDNKQDAQNLYLVSDRSYKVARLRALPDGKSESVWTAKLPVLRGVDSVFLKAFTAGSFFHSIFVRNFDSGIRDQIALRTMSWETGQQIAESVLPGTLLTSISRTTGLRHVHSEFMDVGGTLLYTAKEGVFLYRPAGVTTHAAVEKQRTELRQGNLPAERVKHMRRSSAGLEQPEALAFITPAGARIDGDFTEWAGTEPILMTNREDFVPLRDDAKWPGVAAFSAKVYTGWNQEGVSVAVDVADATPLSPRPGSETTTGDRVRIAIDSRDAENPSLEPVECFVVTLALAKSGSFFAQESGAVLDNGPRPVAKVSTSPSGKGRLYELFVPWAVLRKNPGERALEKRELRVGVAAFDGDENGSRGAMEWGAGTTVPGAMPLWMGRLSLIDVSTEKVERYRKIIAMVPGSPEAMKFLRLILVGKRGPNAEAERISELEKFVMEHPDSANTAKAVGMLRDAYRRTNDPDPARLDKLAKRAKVSDSVQLALDAAFKMWVYIDPQKPPQMIMVQFSNGDFTNMVARAYWGSPVLTWGRDGANAMKKIGELPKPGVWTELRVSPFDVDLENLEIKFLALTSVGGLTYFDHVGYTINQKETVLIDGKLPEKWQAQYSPVVFVDSPKRAGLPSMTFGAFHQVDGLYNTHFKSADWAPLMSFASLRPTETVINKPAHYQDICRKAARIIDDTPEGLAFLRRAIDLNEGDDNQKSVKAIDEISNFLKQSTGSTNTYEALKLAYDYIVRAGEANPLEKMSDFIRDTKAPIAAVRAFYSDRAPGWTEWHVLGPFVALGERRGMEQAMEPEKAVDLAFKTQSAERDLAWKKISSKNKNGDSTVDLRALLEAEKESYRGPYFGYAYTKFNSPTKRKVLLAYGAEDVISIWVNGRRVVNEVYTWAQRDKESVEVQLRSGENEILIKVGVNRDRLAFIFRLADLDGKPFDDIKNE
ncbi:MAG: PQQ-binding-like beta-propeller repeat protein [Planctomycetota bacterium]